MTRSSKARRQRIALITGASAGFGAEFARQLAADGYHLILTARRRHRLKELGDELHAKYGVRVLIETADLAEPGGVDKLLRFLDEKRIVPTLFVNNAGFGFHGAIVENTNEATRAMLHVNIVAATLLARSIAERMLARGRGGIINLASLAAYQPCPYTGVYGATKSYLYMFSESLREELHGTPIRVMALCPGMTRTEFHLNAGPPYRMQQESLFADVGDTVRECLLVYRRGKSVYVPGWKNRAAIQIQRFVPRSWVTRLAAWVLAPIGEK
ncbi:SDR family oxidoreductase [bacterium]|nr:SDR family oxidoreductase [bacterium]